MGRHTRVPQTPSLRRISLPHGLEGVGGLAHRRDHNHRRTLGIQMLNQQRADAPDGVGVADRGPTKFVGGTTHGDGIWVQEVSCSRVNRPFNQSADTLAPSFS